MSSDASSGKDSDEEFGATPSLHKCPRCKHIMSPKFSAVVDHTNASIRKKINNDNGKEVVL